MCVQEVQVSWHCDVGLQKGTKLCNYVVDQNSGCYDTLWHHSSFWASFGNLDTNIRISLDIGSLILLTENIHISLSFSAMEQKWLYKSWDRVKVPPITHLKSIEHPNLQLLLGRRKLKQLWVWDNSLTKKNFKYESCCSGTERYKFDASTIFLEK